MLPVAEGSYQQACFTLRCSQISFQGEEQQQAPRSRRTGFEPCFLNIVAAPRVQGPFSFIARRRHPCCWGSKSPPTSPSCAQHAQYVYKLTHIIVFRRTTTGAAAQYNNVRLTQYQFRFSPPPHHLTTNCLMLFQNPKKSKKFIESTRLLAQQKSKL